MVAYCKLKDYLDSAVISVFCDSSELSGKLENFTKVPELFCNSNLITCPQVAQFTWATWYLNALGEKSILILLQNREAAVSEKETKILKEGARGDRSSSEQNKR